MNCVNKYFLVFEEAFWDNYQMIGYSGSNPRKYSYFVNLKFHDPNNNSLMTFAFSQPARDTELMSDQQVVDEIIDCLRDIYGKDIPAPVKFLRTKWNSNPNAYGAYSYFGLGS